MENLYNHNFGDYASSNTINKLFIKNKNELKDYIKTMVIPILNCAFIENKYLFFKDSSAFKIEVK